MNGSYDTVASFYDSLANLIFGNTIKKSQKFLIDAIPSKSKILIIGGGTGWILEEISAKHASGLQITYVDVSKKMIDLSKKRNIKNNQVVFVAESILETELNSHYDVVITPFILDNISDENIERIINKITSCIDKNGLWLHADFQIHNNSLWQKIFLKMMFLFFKITCGIEASSLAETKRKFEKRGYILIAAKNYFSSFICSVIYQKT